MLQPEASTQAFPNVLDATQVSEYRTCALRFHRRFNLNLVPSGQVDSVHLHFGRTVAKGLEVARRAYYTDGLDTPSALQAAHEAMDKEWGDYESPDRSIKTLETAHGALEFYFTERPMADDYIRPYDNDAFEWNGVIKLPFTHPATGDPLLYAGKFDMLGVRNGLVMPVDEKTTTRLGATWGAQWHTRSQFLGYMYVCKELVSDLSVAGVMVRGIALYKSLPNFKLAEEFVPYNEKLVQAWHRALIHTVADMISSYNQGYWQPDLDAGCNSYMTRCPYAVLCESQSDLWLADFDRAEPWNPLFKEPTT